MTYFHFPDEPRRVRDLQELLRQALESSSLQAKYSVLLLSPLLTEGCVDTEEVKKELLDRKNYNATVFSLALKSLTGICGRHNTYVSTTIKGIPVEDVPLNLVNSFYSYPEGTRHFYDPLFQRTLESYLN